MKYFLLVLASAILLVGFLVVRHVDQRTDQSVVTVYKSPTCGCCGQWIEHLEAAGFTVRTVEVSDLAVMRAREGVPADLSSCHTAVVDGYAVEGHVPADVVQRLLAETPNVRGIAVPDMPAGSPGMELPGRSADPYEVVAFGADGTRAVFARR